MHVCLCINLYLKITVVSSFLKKLATRSITVKYSPSFSSTFANQNIEAQSQHISKCQNVNKQTKKKYKNKQTKNLIISTPA